MRQVSGRKLWLGHAGDLRNPAAILAADVAAVVELGDSEPFADLPRDVIRCRFPLSDGGDNPEWLLRLAADSVATFLWVRVPVLVACSAGMSRSVCVAAAGVALKEGLLLADALVLVAGTGPADVSPRLFEQLRQAVGERPAAKE